MGSSASATANGDGTITIAISVVEEHRRKFSELENKLKEAENLNNNLKSKNYISENLLSEERENSSLLRNRVEQLVTETSRLESEVGALKSENLINIIKSINLTNNNEQLRTTNDTLQTSKTATTNEMLRLKSQIADHQKTIDELTKQIEETEQRLTQETSKAAQSKRMLDNERKQNKDSEQALKKQCTEVKVQNDQLQQELIEIRKTKLFSIQVMLDDLNKRIDAISNEIFKSVKNNNNRENFMTKFQILKDGNDRLIKDLTSVSFTKRLYESHHDALLKLHDETDKKCRGTLKTIHELTRDCKKLINDYNTCIPDSFLKAIADHNGVCDSLDKVNFSSAFAKELAMQDTILTCLSKEKDMLESILNAEKSNNHNKQVGNEKPKNVNNNNINHINNLDSKQTYDLVVYNMVEASDHYADIVAFETFMQTVTGRKINLLGVQRFGVQCKTPRTAKITFDSFRDYEDVLNSNFERYGRIRVAKFDANKKKAKKNVNN